MKRNSYMIAAALIAVLLVLFGILIAAGDKKENDPEGFSQYTHPVVDYGVSSESLIVRAAGDPLPDGAVRQPQTASGETYYLMLQNGQVRIYREDGRTFYDYADVDLEIMPVEIVEQLKLGLYITGEDELYDFLQTYSS